MDKIIALLLLVILSPLIVVSLILVWLEDGGPVLFKQSRVGINGISFTFYKLRSMKRNTPEVSSNDLKNPEDYLLKTGKFFRKTSIDELPNLVNIIKGDMNFIGPRPLLAVEVKLNELREKYGINTLKPGLTGWAQVNGRDKISIERKVVLERFYLRHKSLKLKTIILIKSIIIVLRATGVRF